MEAEWAGVVIGAGGVAVALISAGIALYANRTSSRARKAADAAVREAEEANRIAVDANAIASGAAAVSRTALDLQQRIDDRQAEFEEVTWEGTFNPLYNPPRFTLRNTGLTDALDVHVVTAVATARRLHRLGTVPAGESRDVVLDEGLSANEVFGGGWRVHWRSPLGNSNEQSQGPIQLY